MKYGNSSSGEQEAKFLFLGFVFLAIHCVITMNQTVASSYYPVEESRLLLVCKKITFWMEKQENTQWKAEIFLRDLGNNPQTNNCSMEMFRDFFFNWKLRALLLTKITNQTLTVPTIQKFRSLNWQNVIAKGREFLILKKFTVSLSLLVISLAS